MNTLYMNNSFTKKDLCIYFGCSNQTLNNRLKMLIKSGVTVVPFTYEQYKNFGRGYLPRPIYSFILQNL